MNYDTSNLTRYIEAANIDHRLIKKAEDQELKESISKVRSRIKESIDDSKDGWWVPISFYEKKNANGRIYGKSLWENVINNQKDIWVGAPMLEDHPEGDSDGSPKDICGVWLDARLDPPDYKGEGLVYGLLIPSGRNGDDLKDHLTKGLKIGTSSSGFGKLMGDGVTVDPNSFVIERLSDWVLNPSQGTFFSYDEGTEEVVDHSKGSIKESTEIRESTDIIQVKEKFVKDSKIAKLEEKKFRRDMESFLEDASNIKDPQERLLEFKEIESYLEDGACPDLRKKIEEKIAEEEEYIRTALREKAELKDELQIENPRDLKQKLTKIVEDAAILDQEAKDWKKISESLQQKLTETKEALEDRPTEAYATYLREKNTVLSTDLKEKTSKASSLIRNVTAAYKESAVSNSKLVKQVKELQISYNSLKEKADKNIDFLSKMISVVKELRENMEASSSKYKELAAEYEKLASLKESLDKTNKDLLIENKKFKDLSRKNKEEIQTLKENLNKIKENIRSKKRKSIIESKKEAMTVTEKYYESLRKTYGNAIAPFKKDIAGAVTIAEAKKVFFEKVLQNLPESQAIEEARMPESLYMTPEKRASKLGSSNFRKAGVVERLPNGWY